MSIYDKSSLVLIPSGTKTGKIFSQKPVSGDGDFTFTRASAATRVNADGNIEKETGNLLLQSNNFDTTWVVNNGASVTSGQSGYDGSSDAWLLTKPATSFTNVAQTISTSGIVTFSVRLKAGTLTKVTIRLIGTDVNVIFDLSNGTIFGGTSTGWIDRKITDLGGGWYLGSITAVYGSGAQVGIYPDEITNTTSGTIYIQDAQLEQGLVARDVITTTTAAVYGGITDNTPRLDYTDSSCPALLLEPQRSNLVTQSEYTGNYINYGSTDTANSATSPQGVNNATLIEGNGTQTQIYTATPDIIVSSAGLYTLSIFAKKGTNNYLTLFLDGFVGSSNNRAFFDLLNVSTPTSGASIKDYGNGWYRCSITATIDAGDLVGKLAFNVAESDDNVFFSSASAANGKNIYIYGAQLELGSYATSYIPTYGSSVSRVADGSLSLPTSQTLNDFTLYWEGNLLQDGQNMLFGGGTGGWYLDVTASTGRIVLDTNSGRKYQALSTLRANQKHKVLMKRTNGVVDAFVDGVKLSPSTQVTDTTALSLVSIAWGFSSTYYPKMKLNEVLTIQSALTDQEAIDLTTI